MRIRWVGIAKGAVILAAVLLTLQVLPDLLRPPQPPPLEADVGLPRITSAPRAAGTEKRGPKPQVVRRQEKKEVPRAAMPSPAPAPLPPPVAVPEPAAPIPAPAPPPASVGDGSEEFAPR